MQSLKAGVLQQESTYVLLGKLKMKICNNICHPVFCGTLSLIKSKHQKIDVSLVSSCYKDHSANIQMLVSKSNEFEWADSDEQIFAELTDCEYRELIENKAIVYVVLGIIKLYFKKFRKFEKVSSTVSIDQINVNYWAFPHGERIHSTCIWIHIRIDLMMLH